ncbi:MAG: periplasmic heavy metal sensor [Bryobacteraceae bacterium]
MRYFFLLLLAAASVWAQGGVQLPGRFPAQIREYLGLTEAQQEKIQQQNEAFFRYTRARSQRIYAVQREITVETAREPLDPAALGVRVAEVESIRREIAERNARLIADNLLALSEAQKTKLKALEEALRLVAIANEAQATKLLADDCAESLLTSAVLSGGRLGLGLGVCSPLPGALVSLFP